MKHALDYIDANFAARIEVADLARRVGLSVSQFERHFTDLFSISPSRYVRKVRFDAALEMLREGGAVADVAHACGYSDQSAFTRRFRAATGMSPLEYRRAQEDAERSMSRKPSAGD
jgi:AraC-like DNA-binding protein